jgi:hypothetical protein
MAIDRKGLREQLEEITDRYADDRVAEQIPRIAELNARFPHSISLLHAAIPDKPETFQFNCYQHVQRSRRYFRKCSTASARMTPLPLLACHCFFWGSHCSRVTFRRDARPAWILSWR